MKIGTLREVLYRFQKASHRNHLSELHGHDWHICLSSECLLDREIIEQARAEMAPKRRAKS